MLHDDTGLYFTCTQVPQAATNFLLWATGKTCIFNVNLILGTQDFMVQVTFELSKFFLDHSLVNSPLLSRSG